MICAYGTFTVTYPVDLVANERDAATGMFAYGPNINRNTKIVFFLNQGWRRRWGCGDSFYRLILYWRSFACTCRINFLATRFPRFHLKVCGRGWLWGLDPRSFSGMSFCLCASLHIRACSWRDNKDLESTRLTGIFINSSNSNTGLYTSEQHDQDLRPS